MSLRIKKEECHISDKDLLYELQRVGAMDGASCVRCLGCLHGNVSVCLSYGCTIIRTATQRLREALATIDALQRERGAVEGTEDARGSQKRLAELAAADKAGRVVILPDVSCTDADGEEALRRAIWECSHTNNGVTRFAADAIAEKLCRVAEAHASSAADDGDRGAPCYVCTGDCEKCGVRDTCEDCEILEGEGQ